MTWNTTFEHPCQFVSVPVDGSHLWVAGDHEASGAMHDELAQLYREGRINGEPEVVLTVAASGYDSPATQYDRHGDPGDPAEHDDERIVTAAAVTIGKTTYQFTAPAVSILGDLFAREIKALDISEYLDTPAE